MAHASTAPRGRYLLGLSLTALGVVYGDIGTSPLYALRECFSGPHGLPATPGNIDGVLSLICWSLILVISFKYLLFVLQADNKGEGGILALTALVTPLRASAVGGKRLLIALGLFGAALLYGDGMITPAISVLSAVEGLEVATPVLTPYILPLTIVILCGLFYFQHHGTAGVGRVFGPLTLLWFTVLALLGVVNIIRGPEVLAALNPWCAVLFFAHNGWAGFLVLGAVFLVVTGGEALYADMGHFGTHPIRLAWFAVALPALLLNYFGQGALLLHNPAAAANPFYRMAPGWALYPLVLLATVATVIASQAVISGAFSLTMQAVQLGYSPRVDIEHTSTTERGQIYLPLVNWGLMLCCIGLVLGFGSSSNLAAAYGVAVTTTMGITTLLFFVVARHRWRWSLPAAGALCGLFLVFDLAFFGANAAKIVHGGWFPLLVAALVFSQMATWKWGRNRLRRRLQKRAVAVEPFVASLEQHPLQRVEGTAVYMSGQPQCVPSALLHNLKHNRVLHERVLLLSVETAEEPYVAPAERLQVVPRKAGFFEVTVLYGFMEDPSIPAALAAMELDGWQYNPLETSFFLGRETLLASEKPLLLTLRERLFILMSRNSRRPSDYFGLPSNRVIELGIQLQL